MNLLLENTEQMPVHTDMRRVFEALPGAPEGYDWLITDLECNFFPDERFSQDTLLITGEELAGILNEHDIQFDWAVFSALPKGFRPDISREARLPYADGNPGFWRGSPKVQLPGALFEIVCRDSTSTLLIGASPDMAKAEGYVYDLEVEAEE